MPRGRAFTVEEENHVRTVFRLYSTPNMRMRGMRSRVGEENMRSYNSYVTRWRTLRRIDGQSSNNGNGGSILANVSRFINELSDDSDDSDSSDDEDLTITINPPPAPIAKKRTIDMMNEEELDKYQEEMMNKIKRRKEELEKEKTAIPECPLCLDEITKHCVVASCGHVFCTECYCKTLSRDLPRYDDTHHKCPSCRSPWNKPNEVKFMASDNITVADCKAKGAIISV